MLWTPRETLRQLCMEFGWSYAVFWKAIGFPSPTHLICEDGYYKQKPGTPWSEGRDLLLEEEGVVQCSQNDCFEKPGQLPLIVLMNKMISSKVHVIGNGLVGESASTGNHQWIILETHNQFDSMSKGFAEMNDQLVGGIKTIVVIPVLPFAVVQLGSIQMVPKNIGFVNHVKSLFMQQCCGSGALSSDAVCKILNQNGQMYPSPVILMSSCQHKNSCTNIGNLLSTTVDGCNPGMVKSPFPLSSIELNSVVSSKFIGKMPPGTSEVMPSKQIKETTYPVGKPVHLNSQLRNRLLRNQAIFPKLDTEPIEWALPIDIISECQNQPSVGSSVLSSNSLKLPNQQLLYASCPGKLETESSLPLLMEDTKSASGFARSEPLQNSTDFDTISFHPCRTTEGLSSSSNLLFSEALEMSCQQNHSCSSSGILEVLKENQCFSVNNISCTVSKSGIRKEENDLAQISSIIYSESGMLGSCSGLHAVAENHPFSSSNLVHGNQMYRDVTQEENDTCTDVCRHNVEVVNAYKFEHESNLDTLLLPLEHTNLGCDLFDVLDLDCKTSCLSGSLDDVLVNGNSANSCTSGIDTFELPAYFDLRPLSGSLNDDISCSGVSSVTDGDQLLDAVISKINSRDKQVSDDTISCSTYLAKTHNSNHAGSLKRDQVTLRHRQDESFTLPALLVKAETSCSSQGKSPWNTEMAEEHTKKIGVPESQIHLWVDNTENIQYDEVSASNGKKVAEVGKLNRKRPRLGENPRPRPKDRQMLQDRIKELREIIPNGAKCSIDALLEKTIKHMLFLQRVRKHADKLQDTGEPKISNQEGGLLLKDNFDGGATWAFELGTQSMSCPIIVEDLNPPRQMVAEMLCEERGFFLEIADFIKGLGLTILNGVMESRKNKVWARFAVEANRDVTRMEIFLSLVRLFEPTSGSNLLRGASNLNMPNLMLHQTSIPATGSSDHLQ